jgi:hypothetical protein
VFRGFCGSALLAWGKYATIFSGFFYFFSFLSFPFLLFVSIFYRPFYFLSQSFVSFMCFGISIATPFLPITSFPPFCTAAAT